jgi:hypothetical protein
MRVTVAVPVVVSVMVHVVVIVLAAIPGDDDDSRWPSLPVAQQVQVAVSPPPTAIDQPIEVIMLGEIGPIGTSHATSPGPSQLHGSAAIATSGRGAGPETGKSGANTGKRSALMTMRAGEKPKLTLSGDFLGKFMENTKPLEPHGDVTVDIDTQIGNLQGQMRAHARIDPGYDVSGDLAQIVALKEQKNHVELVRQKDGTYESQKETYVAKVERDGTVHLHDKPNWQQQSLFFAKFDVTDALMRSHKDDPYAADKLRYLDRTRDQRVRIGKEYRKEVAAHAGDYMTRNLMAAWGSTTDLAKRKQMMFDLWDDCAETGDDQQIAAGHAARVLVERWIQMKLVGPNVYTAAELLAFNKKRTSKQPFAPYE